MSGSNRPFGRKLASYALLVAFGLSSTELTARIMFWSDRVRGLILTYDDDLNWRRMWLDRHRQRPLEVYYAFDRYDPTKGWFSAPNFHADGVWDYFTVSTNSKGLRGAREFDYERKGSEPRILILGDSFTFGDEESDDEIYAHFLQQMMPGAEVINMGVHGYGHDQMLILLREEGIKYHPDVIILGFVYVDVSRNGLTFRDYAKPKFEWTGRELVAVHTPVPAPSSVERWDWIRPRSYDLEQLLIHRLKDRGAAGGPSEVEELTAHILDGIAETARANDARPLFVYLPTVEDLTDPAVGAKSERFLLQYCEARPGLECISLLPSFRAKMRREDVTSAHGRHWSAQAHRLVAEGIRDHLARTGVQ